MGQKVWNLDGDFHAVLMVIKSTVWTQKQKLDT